MKFAAFSYEQPASSFDWFGLLLAVQASAAVTIYLERPQPPAAPLSTRKFQVLVSSFPSAFLEAPWRFCGGELCTVHGLHAVKDSQLLRPFKGLP